MSVATERYPQKIVNLCKALRKGPVPLKSLSDELLADEVLGQAFVDGLIQVGRQAYSLIPQGPGDGLAGRVRKDRSGHMEVDEQKRAIVDIEYRVAVENEWSWLDRTQQHRQPLSDVLAEETPKGVPPLCARLTSAGLAVS